MGWKDGLTQFIANIAKNGLVNINVSILENLSKIQICTNSVVDSNIISLDDEKKILTLNVGKMPQAAQEALAPIIKDAYAETGSILREDTRERIVDFRQSEKNSKTQEMLAYFRPLIPESDLPILRSSFYLRECHQSRAGVEVSRIKGAIIETYGNRGRNIANLCTAGYFETWFMPLHETLQEEFGDDALEKQAFLKIYDTVVAESPWTVFVSRHHAREKICAEIIGKLKKNSGYGTKWLHVHGLGRDNVKTIKSICDELEGAGLAIMARSRQEHNRISVRLECAQPNDDR